MDGKSAGVRGAGGGYIEEEEDEDEENPDPEESRPLPPHTPDYRGLPRQSGWGQTRSMGLPADPNSAPSPGP
jgi:hypothetical protein